MSASFTLQLVADEPQELSLPLFPERVSAGFRFSAQDYVESGFNLNQYCVGHPAATFFFRASGGSMASAGIKDRDLLVIDYAVTPEHGDIIVATADGGSIVWQLRPRLALRSLNPPHQAIYVDRYTLDTRIDFVTGGFLMLYDYSRCDVSNTGMQVLYFAFCLLPVIAKLRLTAYFTLESGEFLLLGFKAVYSIKNGAI